MGGADRSSVLSGWNGPRTPDNARIAADGRGFAIEVGLTGDGADRGDLFAAWTAAGARRPAGPETAGGLALRLGYR
jgi:hypothetical protein